MKFPFEFELQEKIPKANERLLSRKARTQLDDLKESQIEREKFRCQFSMLAARQNVKA